MSFKLATMVRYVTRLFGRERHVGCIFLARENLKIGVLQHRISADTESYGVVGGPVYVDESMMEAAIRYAEIHAGHVKRSGEYLVRLNVYANDKIRHVTYVYVVHQMFFGPFADNYGPISWIDFDTWPFRNWPRPLDRYVVSMLYNDKAFLKLYAEIRAIQQKKTDHPLVDTRSIDP